MLDRLKRNEETEIAVPVFDRALEIARAGAQMIPQTVRHLIVEGNYLLLNNGGWRTLHRHFDTTVTIDADEPELRRRLAGRWKDLSPEERTQKIDSNDLPNGRLVTTESVRAEFRFRQ
jgi:pantothenate kinase